MSAIEELEKLADPMSGYCTETARKIIRALLPRLRAEVSKRERAAVVAGADLAVEEDYGEMGIVTAVAAVKSEVLRRYPDKEA